jgi:hypothetical protein
MGNGTPAESRNMLGADQCATARHVARRVRRSAGRSRWNQDAVALIALDQRVVDFLAQRGGKWFCDSCLALALGLPERHAMEHAVEYVTDDLAAGRTHSRSRGACRDCRRHTIVTTAN